MPEKQTLERARRDKKRGKAATTQAGEFVREELHHIRQGKHGARSPQQAIAIGLSKARRAGVKLPPSRTGKATTKRSAERHKPSRTRSRAVRGALKREGRSAASHSAAAKKAARTRAHNG